MTTYEQWQQERYGSILEPSQGLAPANDNDRIIESRLNTIHETEVNNLNNE